MPLPLHSTASFGTAPACRVAVDFHSGHRARGLYLYTPGVRDRFLQRANRLEDWLEATRGRLPLLPARIGGWVLLAVMLLASNLVAMALWPLHRRRAHPAGAVLADGGLHDVDANKLEAALAGPTPVLVDFWAPWCGPCVMMEPALRSLADRLSGRLAIVRVDCTRHEPLAKRHGVRALPTLVLYRENCELDRIAAALSTVELREWVEAALPPPPE